MTASFNRTHREPVSGHLADRELVGDSQVMEGHHSERRNSPGAKDRGTQ